MTPWGKRHLPRLLPYQDMLAIILFIRFHQEEHVDVKTKHGKMDMRN